MSEEQISNIIERVSRQFDMDGVPYTRNQLRDCIAGYARLLDETGIDDYGRELAAAIFSQLMKQAFDADNPWDWVATELRFEAQAEAMGDRVQAASNYLRYRVTITDQDLDLYNDRVNRFAESSAN